MKKKFKKQQSLTTKKPLTFITGGCSFSETKTHWTKTWPRYIEKSFDANVISTGMGSEGNGMISRRVIHAVHTQLKTIPAEEIIVGVMWSGPSRHEQYTTDKTSFPNKNIDSWMENPTAVVSRDPGGWIIYNSHWRINQAKNYYKHMYNNVYSQIQTLEHIIRTQNYLKLLNIKYFMSTYMDEVFALTDNSNLDHLYEQIDYEYFLTNQGMLEWSKATGLQPKEGDHHPTNEMHQLYTKEIIIPFLKNKYNIDNVN